MNVGEKHMYIDEGLSQDAFKRLNSNDYSQLQEEEKVSFHL